MRCFALNLLDNNTKVSVKPNLKYDPSLTENISIRDTIVRCSIFFKWNDNTRVSFPKIIPMNNTTKLKENISSDKE